MAERPLNGGSGWWEWGRMKREGVRPRAVPTESDWSRGRSTNAPVLSKMRHLFSASATSPHSHRYFLTCYCREADDERGYLRPRVRRPPADSPSAERAGRTARLPSDPTLMLARIGHHQISQPSSRSQTLASSAHVQPNASPIFDAPPASRITHVANAIAMNPIAYRARQFTRVAPSGGRVRCVRWMWVVGGVRGVLCV